MSDEPAAGSSVTGTVIQPVNAGRPGPAVRAFPVSVKGVAVRDGQVLLLENERAEWELPGGKLELGEDPPGCVMREIAEVPALAMPAGYKRSVAAWFARLNGAPEQP